MYEKNFYQTKQKSLQKRKRSKSEGDAGKVKKDKHLSKIYTVLF